MALSSGMVSWWQGEGNELDQYGNNHGNLINNAGYAEGKKGLAFNFDGSGDLVKVTNAPNLQLQTITIEAWVKRSSPSVASFGSGNVGVLFGFGTGGYIFYVDGTGVLYFGRLGDFLIATSSTISVNDTNYHHVAVTREGANIVFYVDGVASPAFPYDPIFTFNTDAAIGARSDNFDNSFFGRIDELSIYSRALAQSELQAMYAAGVDGKCELPAAPQLLSQPADTDVEYGGTTSFAVLALGAQPLYYQWFHDGELLLGATNATLLFHQAMPEMAGEYSVLVTNTYGSVLSAIGILSVGPAPTCVAWPQGIVSWWRAESNAFDHFGLNSGTPVGNTSFGFGRVGSGLYTDGAGDLIVVTNQPSLQLQNLTIEGWVRRGSSTVASYGSGGNGVLFGYGTGGYITYMNNAGRIFFGKQGSPAIQSSWLISDTNFHHVAITKSNSVVTFYLDGTNFSTTTYLQTFTFATGVGIGGRADNLDNSFFGIIDELAVYDHGLSAAEIESIRLAGASGKCYVPIPPAVAIQPSNRTVNAGDSVSFAPVLMGTPPFLFQWFRNGSPITGATNASLILNNVQPSQSGAYDLSITNAFGVAQSSNASLKVIVVSALGNGLPLTNSSYAFNGSVTIQLQNVYAGGLTFYTLDGSSPTFASLQYDGPFVVSNSVVLRALGYRADFFEFGELPPVTIQLPPSYPLQVGSDGGGSITVNPSSGTYLSNTVVTLTATPNAGWTFLKWLGDVSGTNVSTNVAMTRAKAVQAVFGTTLGTTAVGGGTVVLNPLGGFYPYGTMVQLSAVPDVGNQFAIWGNAASGNANPLGFMVTNANPVVSSLFAPVSGGQSALTVIPVGAGTVAVTPRANVYTTGANVTITATPEPGQTFLGWSGDAGGMVNPLPTTVDSNRTIYASFTHRPYLSAFAPAGLQYHEGVRLTVMGKPNDLYQLESSPNLMDWLFLANVTNTFGSAQFIDGSATNSVMRFYRAKLLQ